MRVPGRESVRRRPRRRGRLKRRAKRVGRPSALSEPQSGNPSAAAIRAAVEAPCPTSCHGKGRRRRTVERGRGRGKTSVARNRMDARGLGLGCLFFVRHNGVRSDVHRSTPALESGPETPIRRPDLKSCRWIGKARQARPAGGRDDAATSGERFMTGRHRSHCRLPRVCGKARVTWAAEAVNTWLIPRIMRVFQGVCAIV